jgi:serine/threonine protein kinase
VAIKTPHFEGDPTGELLQRFYREAEAAATLLNANICPVYDVGQIEGRHFISMAYIEGRPLSDLVRGGKLQNERHIVIAVHKLARALQQAHDHGIVHRDLKPANIMINRQGEPVIMDFGLARKRRAEGEASLTHSGVLLGSPAYMSPEQIDGDPDSVGPASDQYSLGVVLYEMLTRQLPFGGSVVNVLAQILTKDFTRPSELRPGLDPRIEAVCLRMMSKKASDRFPSMTAVAEGLYAILKSPVAEPIAADKSPTASRSPAAPAPSRGDAGTSQIRKSVKQKVLTESDLTSLEELVQKCLKRRDYDQMIQIIERIPEERRNAALQALLEKAREKADEISFLVCEIDEADRFKDARTALKKAEELVKIKPGHHRARAIQEKYSGYGEGGAARIGPLSQFTRPWSEGGWIPWSVLAFGLAVFGVMSAVIVIYLRGTAVVVEIDAPGIELTVNDVAITVKGPGKEEVKVEPGKQELKITYAGLETITKSFSLKRGDKKTVTVYLADAKLIAKLGNEVLMEQDIKSAPAGRGAKPPQGVAQSPPDENEKEAPATTGSADPDRTAAEWVLSIGGTIKIEESGQEREIKAANELRREAFELTVVDLHENRKVTTAGLAHFKDCKSVKVLQLWGTQVSDAGLAYFKDCKNLTALALSGTHSDAGLAYFKDCKKLTWLGVGSPQVTNAGLALFKDCKNLTRLELGGATHVSNAGLAHFKDCKNLDWLILWGTQVSDAGLAYFKDCKILTYLHLGGTQVTDAGLAYFKDCKNLTWLVLDKTEVTDASLERFAGFRKLDSVNVKKTNVTEAGVKKLAAALPRCKIEWDGGVIAPKANVATTNAPTGEGILNSSTDPDRRAAEWVLSIGGRIGIEVGRKERDIAAPDRVPPQAFRLRTVRLANNPKVSDAGLACASGCRNLKALDLYMTKVSDAGLAYFKDCKDLDYLSLGGTQVTDAGLANFKHWKNLGHLELRGTRVSDAGLACFKDCKNLWRLDLGDTQVTDPGLALFKDWKKVYCLGLEGTRVTDTGLAYLKGCKNLGVLGLGGTSVSDAGVVHLKRCRNLTELDLTDTKVTDATLERLADFRKLVSLVVKATNVTEKGVKKFAAARPRCKIEWDAGVIGPKL